jgi:hypothetical protein
VTREGKVFLPSGSPDTETPKRRPAATCPFDGRWRPSTKIDSRGIFGMINGHDQIQAFLNLNHTSLHFEASVIEISQLTKTRVLCPFVFQVPKRQSASSGHVCFIDGRSRNFHGPWGLWSRFLHLLQGKKKGSWH